MRDLLTTRNQNCWKELIEKEAFTRLSWKLKYGQQQETPRQGTRKRRGLSNLPAVSTLLPLIHAPRIEEQEKGPQKQVPREPASSSRQQASVSEMRPATPQTLTLLYQGFSKEGKGRSLYLRQRKLQSPEHKFQHPVLSSWEYGWRLGDVVKETRIPVHGRSGIVKDTFYVRNGVFYHPSETDKMLYKLP